MSTRMSTRNVVSDLRRRIGSLEGREPPLHEMRQERWQGGWQGGWQEARRETRDVFTTGFEEMDLALQGGLARGGLHEVYAAAAADVAAATGFALALARRAGVSEPLVIVSQDRLDAEAGHLYGHGLVEFGLDPGRILLVRAPDAVGLLRAAAEAVRCPALGAVLIALDGEPRALDLVASRRLSLASRASRVTTVMVRAGARPVPSAAETRWSIRAVASTSLDANAPGRPAFAATLLRHRAGISGRTWSVEWDRDKSIFRDHAPLSGRLVSLPVDGTVRPVRADGSLRRTG